MRLKNATHHRPRVAFAFLVLALMLLGAGGIALAELIGPKRIPLAETERVAGAPERTLGLSRVVIPPGSTLPLHRHPGTQIAWFKQGVLTYTVVAGAAYLHRGEPGSGGTLVRRIEAGQTARLKAGQWLVEPPSDIHRAVNRGKEPVVVMVSTLFRTGAPPAIPVDLAAIAGSTTTAMSASSSKTGEPTTTLGKKLAGRFFRLLVRKDRPGLRGFLTKGWQVERSDGTGVTGRKAYIAELKDVDVKKFRLSSFRVTRSRNVLVVRYRSQVTESLNQSPLTQSKAPRLSTFSRIDGRWRMTSHANFAPLPK
jgi:quercetin dioxygenase-like cupin family protein